MREKQLEQSIAHLLCVHMGHRHVGVLLFVLSLITRLILLFHFVFLLARHGRLIQVFWI